MNDWQIFLAILTLGFLVITFTVSANLQNPEAYSEWLKEHKTEYKTCMEKCLNVLAGKDFNYCNSQCSELSNY